MLNSAHAFASKWNMKFNKKKSKVMIIGKRVSNKLWPLGPLKLQETRSYKYLGVFVNNRLKDNDHMWCMVKGNQRC